MYLQWRWGTVWVRSLLVLPYESKAVLGPPSTNQFKRLLWVGNGTVPLSSIEVSLDRPCVDAQPCTKSGIWTECVDRHEALPECLRCCELCPVRTKPLTGQYGTEVVVVATPSYGFGKVAQEVEALAFVEARAHPQFYCFKWGTRGKSDLLQQRYG